MNGVIKFRALDVNGIWHYGNLNILRMKLKSEIDKGCYISNRAGYPFAYHVRHETVGQYTGMKDKNRKEIYKGDIFLHFFDENKKGIVKYGEYMNAFGDDGHGGHVGFYVEWEDENIRKDLGFWASNSRIVGNIYENEELLEGEE